MILKTNFNGDDGWQNLDEEKDDDEEDDDEEDDDLDKLGEENWGDALGDDNDNDET